MKITCTTSGLGLANSRTRECETKKDRKPFLKSDDNKVEPLIGPKSYVWSASHTVSEQTSHAAGNAALTTKDSDEDYNIKIPANAQKATCLTLETDA